MIENELKIRLVEQALLITNPRQRLDQLKFLSATQGLVNRQIRAKVWPLLVGIQIKDCKADFHCLKDIGVKEGSGFILYDEHDPPEDLETSLDEIFDACSDEPIPEPSKSEDTDPISDASQVIEPLIDDPDPRVATSPLLCHAGFSEESDVTSSTEEADSSPASLPPSQYRRWTSLTHKDRSVVDCDVKRSLWIVPTANGRRRLLRAALQRVLNALAGCPFQRTSYYQGLHDIASIFLLVLGERYAFLVLRRAASTQLLDFARPKLDAVVSLLGLFRSLIALVDPDLARAMADVGLAPFFAVAWLITWFAHDLKDTTLCCRLFDLFLAGHPMLPLYVGAAAIVRHRARVLKICAEGEMAEVHSFLVNLDITRGEGEGGEEEEEEVKGGKEEDSEDGKRLNRKEKGDREEEEEEEEEGEEGEE